MKLFLLDGSALFYRGYYAFIRNPLVNSKGENVSAIFGFINSVLSLRKMEAPDFMGVIFDCREPTFRHEMFPKYKANREAMPEDLVTQLPKIREFVDISGFHQIAIPGYEADDIIATLAKMGSKDGLECYMVTGDKDFFQVFGPNIHFYNIKSIAKRDEPKILDDHHVYGKFGIHQEQMIDFLALMGDASDNIPGVMGVGQKTASKLLKQFSSVEDLYANIDKVSPGSLKVKLIESKENAFLSKKLVTIDDQLPIQFNKKLLKCPDELPDELEIWLKENELPSLLKYMKPERAESTQPVSLFNQNKSVSQVDVVKTFAAYQKKTYEYESIQDRESFESFLKKILKQSVVSLVFEFLNELQSFAIIFTSQEVRTGVILENDFKKDDFLQEAILQFLHSKEYVFTGTDVKAILKAFFRIGFDVRTSFFDLSLAAFLLDSEKKNPDFNDLISRYLPDYSEDLEGLINCLNEKNIQSMILKGKISLKLYDILTHKIEEQKISDLFYKIEIPLIYVLAKMENTGVLLDIPFMNEMKNSLQEEINSLSETILGFAGEEFNINSTKQLGEILFEKLKIQNDFEFKKIKKTKTGYSTSSETLMKYKTLPVIQALLRYRTLNKLQSTYVDSLIQAADPESFRIHANFNQMVTITGRLSSTRPNLQNIPIRTKEGAKIRQAFIAGADHVLLSADYSQIELRILAHISGDPVMLSAFDREQDIHRETAAKVFNIPHDEVTKSQRNRAKAVNFGVIYGMGPYRLSQDTGMSISEASDFIKNYFSIYAGVKAFMNQSIANARKTEKTRTLFGRIRLLSDINSSRKDKQVLAEHMAVNTPIQGTAADLIKTAMIRIQNRIDSKELKTRMLIQIHDELLFEVPKSELKMMTGIVKSEMENAILLHVPLKVSICTGKNWLEAH